MLCNYVLGDALTLDHLCLTSDVGGYQPQNTREDLVWNRLCNMKGCPGGNIGLDLANEFLNNDFKGKLSSEFFWFWREKKCKITYQCHIIGYYMQCIHFMN